MLQNTETLEWASELIESMQIGDMSFYGGSDLESKLGNQSYQIRSDIISGKKEIQEIVQGKGKVTVKIQSVEEKEG